jgi:hypothetical protein
MAMHGGWFSNTHAVAVMHPAELSKGDGLLAMKSGPRSHEYGW